MKKKAAFFFVFVIVLSISLCAFAEQGDIFFEGHPLGSGVVSENGTEYVIFSEAAAEEGFDVTHDTASGLYSFPWRLDSVVIDADAGTVTYEGETTPVSCLINEDGELLVSVYDFCDALDIGTYTDDEFGTIYCTAGSGDWELPGGYDVAVMMYHATGHAGEGDNLVMPPWKLEEQFQYLNDNGYTTIWFEDLWNVANISKPVILVFDDGWSNNYTNLFPLLKKYNCKATIAIVKDFTDEGSHIHLRSDEVQELAESGYVSIQSHTVTHDYLGALSRESQEYEMAESKRFITRLTGKEPCALIYPSGSTNDDTLDLLPSYYRFGAKMVGKNYNTSDDPRLVYRFFPESQTLTTIYAQWLESVFGRVN